MIDRIARLIDATAALLCRLLGVSEPPVPGADAPPSAMTAGGGAHRPGRVRAPAPGLPHAPTRKLVDVRTCGCVYVWDRADREWNLVPCGTDWAAYARQGRRDLTQWLQDGAR